MPGPATEGGLTVSVHRLVQAVMRARLAAQGRTEVTQTAALNRLAAAFPEDTYNDPSGWSRCRVLMPHVEVLLERLGAEDASAASRDPLSKADSFLSGQGALREAEKYSRRALEACERLLRPEHPDTLISVNNLAECLRDEGDITAAEPLYRRALVGAEHVLEPNHPATVLFRRNLGDLLRRKRPLWRRLFGG